MKPWLDKQEVQELTAKMRPSAQLRQLKSMEMDSLVRYRTDGSFIVMREGSTHTEEKPKKYELDFSGLGNVTQAA